MTSGVPTSKMIAGVLSSVVVCALVVGTEAQVSVTGIRLTLAGQEVPFMNLGNPDLSYVLECNYVASVEDVVNVTWTLDDYGDVYSWHPSTDTVTVHVPLLQGVEAQGPNIHFTTPQPTMRGFYTCKVFHNRPEEIVNPVQDEFQLQMYAYYHDEYEMSASVENCTVSWNFTTPAMYPKPKITCGFWNNTANDLGQAIHGGLFYHQFVNKTWYAFMRDTPVMIEDIPRGSTLYCLTEVPFVNFTREVKVLRDPVNALLYNEVDDQGCPAIPLVDENMIIDLFECQENCRGECKQAGVSPVVAEFKCASGYEAYWEINDTVTYHWRLRVTCNNEKHTWSSAGGQPSTTLELPNCIYSGARIATSSLMMLIFTLLLTSRF